MKLYVHYDSYCIHNEQSDQQYGPWSREYDFSIAGVSTKRAQTSSNEEFTVDFEVVPGDIVYVLSMIYSSGDSFGNADGHGEALWVFKDRLIAEEAKKRWEHACDAHGDGRHDNKLQSCSFRTDSGKYVKLNNPVFGYFEHLTSLNLHAMILQ